MRKVILGLCLVLMATCSIAANTKEKASPEERKDVTGYWYMYDQSKKKSGIAYLYEYDGEIYGRTLVTIDDKTGEVQTYDKPISRAKYLEGEPYTTGLDIIWDLTWDTKKNKYINGYILDPRKRKPYRVDIWREGDILKVFGNIGAGIGATVEWKRADSSALPPGVPPAKKFVPKIYLEIKK